VAKGNRGLPPSFKLDIPDQGPVQLGDYLEEVDAAPVARPAPPKADAPKAPPAPEPGPAAENVVEFRRPHVAAEEAPRSAERAEPRPAPPTGEPAASRRRRRRIPKAPPRKQINTTPETQRMIDEIIDYVQTYSVQRDAKASEIFHALVLTLHESLEELDLSNVPARGRWGTPTAQAFPISLKSAFKAAISRSQKKNPR
jgi:hypothetical protein